LRHGPRPRRRASTPRSREAQALQFLGDTGNIAGKLEQQTKQLDCTMVASVAAVNLVSPGARIDGKAIAIPGKEEPIDVVTFRDVRDLERLLASAPLV
jgi:adenylate cyclase